MVTMPSDADFTSDEVGEWCRKLMVGDARYSVEDRQRILRLIEAMTIGSVAVGYLTESMHGAGSPQAQRIMIGRQANMEEKKALARGLCGIDPDGCFDLGTLPRLSGCAVTLERGRGLCTRISFLRKRTGWLTSR